MQSICLRPRMVVVKCQVLCWSTNFIDKTVSVHTMKSAPMSVVSKWKGIDNWRAAPIDNRRFWGEFAPVTKNVTREEKGLSESFADQVGATETIPQRDALTEESFTDANFDRQSLASWGVLVLQTPDPMTKARLTHEAYGMWKNGELQLGVATAPRRPGRPAKPELVPPKQVPSPSDCGISPCAHLMHNLAHIELNAIDLAWDTVVRFSSACAELREDFFDDFLHVADDESRHFSWCSQRLTELGFSYGDMPAHNLLWKDCMKTSGSVKSRLAVIPMMQEARGLDAGPRLVKKLLALNDHRSAAVVRRIGQEEVAHVNVGVIHFLRVCERIGVDPGAEFKEVISKHQIQLHGPFNHAARQLAGLERHWYDEPESDASEGTEHSTSSKSVPENGNIYQTREKVRPSVAVWRARQENAKTQEIPRLKTPNITTVSAEGNRDQPDNENPSKSTLTEVYQRLALLVAMEENGAARD